MPHANMNQPLFDDIQLAMRAGPLGLNWLLSNYILCGLWEHVEEAVRLTWTEESHAKWCESCAAIGMKEQPGIFVFNFNELHIVALADNWALGHLRDHHLTWFAYAFGDRGRDIQAGLFKTILKNPERYCQSPPDLEPTAS